MENVKKINSKKMCFFALIILIIIVGVAIIGIKGLNFDLKYQSAQKIQLYLENKFEISDIQKITNEVMPNSQVMIQKVEVYEDTVSITAKEITEEQKQNIITKVNEKYGTSLSADNIEIESIANLRGRDIVKKYLEPVAIATVIILAYMAIRYYKLGIIRTVLSAIAVLVIVEVMFVSILAITRIPVCEFTMPVAIVIYILTALVETCYFEKQLKLKTEEEKNKD